MLTQIEKAKHQWGGAHDAIDNWLQERQQLLVQYCELAGLPPFEREPGALPRKSEIRSFCEILVDYVSAGHFEVYDKIAEQSEDAKDNEDVASIVVPQITETTDHALNFNDDFAEVSGDGDLEAFDLKLSKLGQTLEERFALEDQLIQTIHKEHS